jgi:HPt (histidine-containing phosphotransfer) domain-containing protein
MEKLYDLEEFEALAMGDQDFMRELLAANVESIGQGLELITAAYADGDYDTMGKEAHKIKPLLAMLKAGDIHKSIVDMEYYSRKEINLDNVHNAYPVFATKAPVLLQQLKDLIA